MTTVTIKNVDEESFRELKAAAVRLGVPIGKAASEAFSTFSRPINSPRKKFHLKPWDWGPGTEHLSEHIDEVLYGDTD